MSEKEWIDRGLPLDVYDPLNECTSPIVFVDLFIAEPEPANENAVCDGAQEAA